MTMTTTKLHYHRLWRLIAAAAAALVALTGGVSPLRAQSVAVMVNGEPITNYDIDQRSKLTMLTTQQEPPRQEVIEDLIDEKVKIKEARDSRRPHRVRYRTVLSPP